MGNKKEFEDFEECEYNVLLDTTLTEGKRGELFIKPLKKKGLIVPSTEDVIKRWKWVDKNGWWYYPLQKIETKIILSYLTFKDWLVDKKIIKRH